jgi:WD40 repeat protein
MLPLNLSRSRLSLACLFLILAMAPGRAADVKTDVHGDPLPDGAVARAGTVRWRTGAPIVLSAFLADGKSVLTVAQDHVAQVWDATTGQELRRFDVSGGNTDNTLFHGGVLFMPVALMGRGVAASADGKTLAVSGGDGIVRIFDVATGKERSRLAQQEDVGPRMTSLALSRDGKRLARVTFNQQTTIYDTATGKELKQFGQMAAAGPGRGGRGGGMVRIMPYRTEFSADGKTFLLITGERDAARAMMKVVLVIWDVESGKELKRLDEWPEAPVAGPAGGAGPGGGRGFRPAMAMGLVVSPDHKLAALPYDAKTIVLMDLSTGKEAKRIEGVRFGGVGPMAVTMAFTADSKSLVVVAPNRGVAVCDVATGKLTQGKAEKGKEAAQPVNVGFRGRAGQTFVLSEDGKTFTWPEGPTLHLIDVATGKDRNTTVGHTTALDSVRFSSDGKSLLTFSTDGDLRRWDAATGKEVAAPAPRGALGIGNLLSPDGKVLAGVLGAGEVLLFDVASGKTLHTLKVAEQAVFNPVIAFSPDSKTVAVSSMDETKVRLFDVATGLSKRELLLPNRSEELDYSVPRRVVFSGDGRFLAVSDLKLHVWEAATGRELRTLAIPEGAAFRYAAFSPDGRSLAMELSDGEIQLFELATGSPRLVLNAKTRAKPDPELPPGFVGVRRFGGLGSAEPVSLAIAPDGRLLAQTGEDGKIHLWDLRTGKEAASLAGHRGQVTAVAFSADSKRLASGGTDTTALVWDAEAIRKKLPSQSAPLTRDKAEALWEGLGKGDAIRAYEAVRGLAGDPAKTVPLMRERLKPAAAADTKLLARLVADLDADDFDSRENAKKELARLGESAAGALRKALENKPSAEMKRSIDELLAGFNGTTPSDDRVLLMRALETLELMGTPEAVEVLKSLAGGAPDAFLTTQAKAALERLRR